MAVCLFLLLHVLTLNSTSDDASSLQNKVHRLQQEILRLKSSVIEKDAKIAGLSKSLEFTQKR